MNFKTSVYTHSGEAKPEIKPRTVVHQSYRKSQKLKLRKTLNGREKIVKLQNQAKTRNKNHHNSRKLAYHNSGVIIIKVKAEASDKLVLRLVQICWITLTYHTKERKPRKPLLSLQTHN